MIPLTSTAHTPATKKIGSNGWDGLLVAQCVADVFVTIMIYAMPWVMFKVDQAASDCIKSREDADERLVESEQNSRSSKVSIQNQIE